MQKILHVLTRENDPLAKEIMAQERALPNCVVELADLTTGRPDYADLLQKIFAAESVAVW